MTYRAKITHCASIIANIYGSQYPYITKDDHDVWIEVTTEEQASIIAMIEHYQSKTYEAVKYLTENL